MYRVPGVSFLSINLLFQTLSNIRQKESVNEISNQNKAITISQRQKYGVIIFTVDTLCRYAKLMEMTFLVYNFLFKISIWPLTMFFLSCKQSLSLLCTPLGFLFSLMPFSFNSNVESLILSHTDLRKIKASKQYSMPCFYSKRDQRNTAYDCFPIKGFLLLTNRCWKGS